MTAVSSDFEPEEFLRPLSHTQRRQLLQQLAMELANTHVGNMGLSGLIGVEAWLGQYADMAVTAQHENSRVRMWFIFMFLRYGALRLPEIFRLTPDDLDFANGVIHISGKHARRVPLPPTAARHMGYRFRNWLGHLSRQHPFVCDASLVRRFFKQCAEQCHVDRKSVTAIGLRRIRGLELEAAGLHPALVMQFLGNPGSQALFSDGEAFDITRRFIQEETRMKTSARNVFQGKITELKEQGILVEVTLQTPAGLNISSIITQTSKKSLALEIGKLINAVVKAPWVTVVPKAQRAAAAEHNCFQGTVESMQKDNLACEIIVTLPEGNQICALYANGASPDASIQKGSEVIASFSAFAVILTEG